LTSQLLIAGEIGKPHGVSGEVYVVRISDDPHRFDPGSRLMHEDGRELEIQSSRLHRDRLLVKFVEADSREEAESLRGTLFVPAGARRELGEAEYWADDLIGCEVETLDGGRVGRIAEVRPGPAQDLLVIEATSGEKLVPLVTEIVKRVDVDNRIVTIDPPEGLLD
jgi:16S rRNA processing protein RimM